MASAKNGNLRPALGKNLGGDDVAQIIARLQDVSISSGTRAGTAGDLLRINDTVKAVADDRLDFFDVPADFARVMKGMS